MRTVKQVSALTGVSVRTLQFYDEIGLLKPTSVTEAGYRLYGDGALEVLQQILFFKELDFSLKEIKAILENPSFDRRAAGADRAQARPAGPAAGAAGQAFERRKRYGI